MNRNITIYASIEAHIEYIAQLMNDMIGIKSLRECVCGGGL